ncbi:MAG: PorV/PorQ family protein [candidate division Zixibacteria bacterium]|nr:PorV/PorQ family protein [candidate division Zixibacteria bacterium]
MRRALVLSFLSIFLVGLCYGEDISDKAGTSGLSFLKIGMGARPVGMGEAFTSVSGDINCLYWNPAGLAKTEGINLTFMHNRWFQEISSNYLAAAFKIKKNTIGVSLALNRVPDIEVRDKPTAEPVGTFDAEDLVLTLGYAKSFGAKFDLGVSVKGLYQKIYTYEASGLGFDIGGIYILNDKFQFGTAILNIGPEMKFEEEKFSLPLIYKLGVAYKTSEKHLKGDIILAMDLVKPKDNDLKLHSGLEYNYNKILFLRMGYQSGYDDKSFSFGMGLGYERYKVDYAFVPFSSDLGNTHRISLEIKM